MTAIQVQGTGGVTRALSGTGSSNLITKAVNGLRFTNGRFLTAAGIPSSTADGSILLVKVTFETATGTGQALDFGETVLRRAAAVLQVSVPQWTAPMAQDVGNFAPPQRVVMGVEFDQVADGARNRNPVANVSEAR
ncbi:MAG: hypothetical protein FJX25_12890, partial [Alphaproteobacteria bacterium]|nr:hypothetical protein [Alphaproteobacteria bacterium]